MVFDIDKLPDNYDINKYETYPNILAEINSSNPNFKDTNEYNDGVVINIEPMYPEPLKLNFVLILSQEIG